MKFYIKIVFLLMSIVWLPNCKPKMIDIEPSVFSIEKEFRPYFNTFLKEAAERNVIIDTTNLIMRLNKSISTDKCGTCNQFLNSPKQQKTIEIYTSEATCWGIATTNAKEALIFHELGHCLLGRIEHTNETFTDGSPKSIMIANNADLYIPCVYVLDDMPENCNKTGRRKYYIDELFNPATPKPSWAK